MRFAVKYILIIISVLIMASCGVKNNPVSSQTSNKQVGNAGFVIDGQQYNLVLKKDAEGNSINYLQYKISYHFENTAGTLNGLGIEPKGSVAYMMISDGNTPVQSGKIVTLESDYSLGRQLNPGTTVEINLSLSGSYWQSVNGTLKPSEGFKVNKQLNLMVE